MKNISIFVIMVNSLKNKSVIKKLFESGETKVNGLLLIKTLESNKPEILFGVSSKKFNRAVDRNRIKRLLRESIKGIILPNKSIAIIYICSEIKSLNEIKSSISNLIV